MILDNSDVETIVAMAQEHLDSKVETTFLAMTRAALTAPVLHGDVVLAALNIIRLKTGPGYSDDPGICSLQHKLSIMLEVARRRSERG